MPDEESAVQRSASPDSEASLLRRIGDGIVSFQTALVAARVPLIAVLAYALIVAVPDQSVEVLRATAEDEPAWRALTYIFFWLFFVIYFSVCCLSYAVLILNDDNCKSLPEWVKHAVMIITLLGPSAASVVPFILTVDVEWSRGARSTMWIYFISMFSFFQTFYMSKYTIGSIVTLSFMIISALVILSNPFQVSWSLTWAVLLLLLFVPGVAIISLVPMLKTVLLELNKYNRQSFYNIQLGNAFFAAFLFVCYLGINSILADFAVWSGEVPPFIFVTGWAIVLLALLLLLGRLQREARFPVLTLVFLIAGCNAVLDWNDNHVLTDMGGPPRAAVAPQPAAEAFNDWLGARRDRPSNTADADPVVLVAAEGGGSRALYMTALVLEEMRARCPRFQHRLFAVVGVSGGSVGAALSAAAAADAPQIDNFAACPARGVSQLSKKAPAVMAAEADLLRPLLRGALVSDLPMQLFPTGPVAWILRTLRRPEWAASFEGTISSLTDRSRYLESGLDLAWREAISGQSGSTAPLLERPFMDAWRGPKGDVPALVLLATDVATGRRVAVSHLSFGNARVVGLNSDACLSPVLPAQAAEEQSRLLTVAEIAPGLDLAMPAAAVLSARFPVMTPAATLPCSGLRWRLVDGGYFENSGLTTALDLMEAIAEGSVAPNRRVRVVLVRIENGRATTDAKTRAGAPPRDPQGGLAELGSPVRAFLGTREARADLARRTVDRAAEAGRWCAPSGPCVELKQVVIALHPCRVAIPLGWSLSEAAREEIRRQVLDPTAAESVDSACGVAAEGPPPPGPLDQLTALVQ